jgi:hypothetical protein
MTKLCGQAAHLQPDKLRHSAFAGRQDDFVLIDNTAVFYIHPLLDQT